MRIVLTGGGTGGHVYPNIAVIAEIKKSVVSHEILYISSKNGMENAILEAENVNFVEITTGKLRRYFSWENFKDFFRVFAGVWQSFRILRRFRPQVVFSKGGYVAVPVVFAACLLRIPVIVHESDVVPGLANKLTFMCAKKILLSFRDTQNYIKPKWQKKCKVTGSIVRENIIEGNSDVGFAKTGFSRDRKVLLVMGGSQGASEINMMVKELNDNYDNSVLGLFLKEFGILTSQDVQVIHITGKGKIVSGINNFRYLGLEYVDNNLNDLYAISDIVVTRGGAGSLAELALLKKKAIIVPMKNASRGEQMLNARYYARRLGWKIVGENVESVVDSENVNFDLGGNKVVEEISKTLNGNN